MLIRTFHNLTMDTIPTRTSIHEQKNYISISLRLTGYKYIESEILQ